VEPAELVKQPNRARVVVAIPAGGTVGRRQGVRLFDPSASIPAHNSASDGLVKSPTSGIRSPAAATTATGSPQAWMATASGTESFIG
jgi:hypothetical protein